MAGAGYKAFADGDVLTAAQVQTYLQDQAVMRFADSSARTTGLGTAVAEGMVSYLQDTDAVEVYDGSAWVAVGLPLGTATPADGDILVYGTATSSWNPTSIEWEDFTPTWTNFTPGNATVSARTRKTGKWREVSVQVRWGSTTSASGNITVDLPEDRRSGDTMNVIGWASVFDFNVNIYPCMPVISTGTSPNTCRLVTTAQPAAAVNATSPITFTTSDGWGFYVAYEVD